MFIFNNIKEDNSCSLSRKNCVSLCRSMDLRTVQKGLVNKRWMCFWMAQYKQGAGECSVVDSRVKRAVESSIGTVK